MAFFAADERQEDLIEMKRRADEEARRVEDFERRKAEFERRYELILPIRPNYPPIMCRDAFLRRLFRSLGLPEIEVPEVDEEEEQSSSDSSKSELSMGNFIKNVSTRNTNSSMVTGISDYSLRYSTYSMSTWRGQGRYDALLESMQRSSLFFMFSGIIDRLRVLYRFASELVTVRSNDMEHGVFSWSMEEFFKRRDLRNFVYLDVLVREYSYVSLDWFKYRTDLLEILRYYKYFYAEIYKGSHPNKMLAMLSESTQMLAIEKELLHSLDDTKQLRKLFESKVAFETVESWRIDMRRLSQELQQQAMAAFTIHPIEFRYLRGYYRALVEMLEWQHNIRTRELEKQLRETKEATDRCDYATNASLLMYDHICSDYRERYDKLEDALANDLEHWEDKNMMTHFHMSKAREDLIEAEEHLIFMQRRVAEVRQQLEEERQFELGRVEREVEARAAAVAALKEEKSRRRIAKRKALRDRVKADNKKAAERKRARKEALEKLEEERRPGRKAASEKDLAVA